MRVSFRSPSLWAAGAVALVAVLMVVQRSRGPRVSVGVVARKAIEKHVVASGRVRVQTRVQVAAQVPGLVVAVAAVEGQHVKAGDLLVQIDDAEARAGVAQAGAAVAQAKARVEQLRRVGAIVANESLHQAESRLAQAEADLDRTERLASTGSVAPVELENARREVDVARAQRSAAEAQQISAAPLGADSRIALTALLSAEAQLAGARVRLSQTRISALHDGLVLTRSVEPGDVVQASRTLLVMAVADDAELVFQPDERNLAFIALGQSARAAADAFPDRPFDGVVNYIAPAVDPQRGSIEVRLRVPSPPPFLKPDMTVSVDLTVARQASALTLTTAAVHGLSSATPWVFVVEGGRVSRKNVRLGIRGEGETEVVGGLVEGELVVIPDGRILSDGERVRPERG